MTEKKDLKDNAQIELVLKGVARPDRAPPGASGIAAPIAPPRQHLASVPSASLTLGPGNAPRKEFAPIKRNFKRTTDDTSKPKNEQGQFKSLHERFNHLAKDRKPKI